MIRIGLSHKEKQKELEQYLSVNDIRKIYVFFHKYFPIKFKTDKDIEYIEYSDIEMYKFFYRLLEEIDSSSLIIIDECLRTQNRSELIYNCAHHYLNQTPHRIIFEFFPLIDKRDDFMILMDFDNPGKYKGKTFDYNYLQVEDIRIKPFRVKFSTIDVGVSDTDKKRYEAKKEQLFDTLGSKDPDTIPRSLQLIAGEMKKPYIKPENKYVARNKRFKLENVKTYTEIKGKSNYIVIDMHYRRLNFNDYLKISQCSNIKYLCTPLSIDSVVTTEFMKWKGRLDAIYAQANLYK